MPGKLENRCGEGAMRINEFDDLLWPGYGNEAILANTGYPGSC